MATMAMDMDITQTTKFSVIAIGLSSFGINAGEWEFKPSFGLESVYSDNISLSDQSTESGYVNQSYLHLENTYQSKHAQLSFDLKNIYAAYDYDDSLNQSFTEFNGNGKFDLWENGLSIIARGSIDNQARNQLANAFANYISADTVEVRNLSAGLQYNTETRFYKVNASAVKSETTSEDKLGERSGESYSLLLESGRNPKNLIWDVQGQLNDFVQNGRTGKSYTIDAVLGVRTTYKFNPIIGYSKEDNTGDIVRPQNFATNYAGFGFDWLVTPKLSWQLSYNRSLADADDGNTFFSSLIRWNPSRRTSLTFKKSKRFYGDSYFVDFKHTNRRWNNTITYTEQASAFDRNFYFLDVLGYFWCPVSSPDSPQDLASCVVQDTVVDTENYELIAITDTQLVESQEFVLNKAFAWNSQFTLNRSRFSLQLNHNDISYLSSNNSSQREGGSVSYNRKISYKASVTFDFSFQKNHFTQQSTQIDQIDYYRQSKITLTRQLAPKLTIDLLLKHLNRDSTQDRFTYEENQVSINLKKSF